MKLQYKISGKGNPVLLVPGGLTGWVSWEPYAKILAEKNKVICVQLLNVQLGLENRDLPADYSGKSESNALAEAIDEIGETSLLDVVGWSYGAFTALNYSLDHPEKIRTLTLIEPPAFWVLRTNGKFDEQTQKEADFLATLKGNITEDMLSAFLHSAGFLQPGQSAREHPMWNNWIPYRQSLKNSPVVVNYTDDKKRLQNFNVPTLLFKGTGSSFWLHNIIDILSEEIPDTRMFELPGGHAPHIASKEKFMELLEKFRENPGN